MSIPEQLRREARGVPGTAPPDLAARMRDLVAAQGDPPPAAIPFPARRSVIWAVAAGLLLVITVTWMALAQRPVPPPPMPVAPRSLPAPPSLDDLLATSETPAPSQTVAAELAALGTDLAAVVRTVRGSIPFQGM